MKDICFCPLSSASRGFAERMYQAAEKTGCSVSNGTVIVALGKAGDYPKLRDLAPSTDVAVISVSQKGYSPDVAGQAIITEPEKFQDGFTRAYTEFFKNIRGPWQR